MIKKTLRASRPVVPPAAGRAPFLLVLPLAAALAACTIPGGAAGEPTPSAGLETPGDGAAEIDSEPGGDASATDAAYPGSPRMAPPTRAAYPAPDDADGYPAPEAGARGDGPSAAPSGRMAVRSYLPRLEAFPVPALDADPRAEAAAPGSASSGASPPRARPPGGDPCAGIVSHDGQSFTLDGEPFQFFGVNVHYLLSPEFPERETDPVVRQLAARGVNTMRVWFFHDMDPERFARLLDVGARHGVRFVVTLEDNVFKGPDWFGTDGDEEDFRPHMARTVSRFKDREEILFWELINEPNCQDKYGPECLDTIKDWLTGRSRELKAIDSCHLVSTGMISAGNYDEEHTNYRRIHRRETIDVLSVHRGTDFDADTELAASDELDKPLFYGEIYERAFDEGCQPLDGDALDERAEEIRDDMRDALEDGVGGYLLWAFAAGRVTQDDGDIEHYCGVFDYEIDDPLWEKLARDEELPPPVPWGPDPSR